MNPAFNKFQQQITNPVAFRLFMLKSLPAAFFAGLRVRTLDPTQSVITVRYKWFNKNPFRSMYFAVQSMAAEMSTGLLASGHIYRRNPPISMLVVGIEAKFVKKVTGLAFFTCADGAAIDSAINETIASGESRTVACRSIGTNIDGETVSEFLVTWSFKVKKQVSTL
jgi:hypothetical protein